VLKTFRLTCFTLEKVKLVGNEALEIEGFRERPFGGLRFAHLFELQLESIPQAPQFGFDRGPMPHPLLEQEIIELIPGRREQSKYGLK